MISTVLSRTRWGILGAFLVACGAFFQTAGLTPLLPVAVAIALAAPLTGSRMDARVGGVYLHLGLLVLAFALSSGSVEYGEAPARLRNLLGQFTAMEGAFFFWRTFENDSSRSSIGALGCSGIVLLLACSATETLQTFLLMPLYFFCLAIGLAEQRSGASSSYSWVGRSVALLAVLAAALAQNVAFVRAKDRLVMLSARLERFERLRPVGGMASQPQLGRTFGLDGSPARMLRLTGYDGGHLRGLSYTEYRDGRWWPVREARNFSQESTGSLNTRRIGPRSGSSVQVQRYKRSGPLLYAPLETARLEWDNATTLSFAQEDSGPLEDRRGELADYRFSLPAASGAAQGVFAWPPLNRPSRRDEHLQLPSTLDPRVKDLARKIVADAGARTDSDRVAAIVGYLQSRYHYSLTFEPGPGDPVTDFLLAEPKRPAHCEYFASAATLLLRGVGVPSRYVTGFLAHEKDGAGLLVRGRDAHAWTEAWVRGVGWVTCDATPGDGQPGDGPIGAWQTAFDRFEDLWLNFQDWLAGHPDLVQLVFGGVVVGVGLWFGVRALMRARRVSTRGAGPVYETGPEALARLGVRFERLMSRRGVPLPPSRPWSEALDPRSAPGAAAFARRYEALRFAGRATVDELDTLAALLAQEEEQA